MRSLITGLLFLAVTNFFYSGSHLGMTPRPNPLAPFPSREGGSRARLPSPRRGGANLYLTRMRIAIARGREIRGLDRKLVQ